MSSADFPIADATEAPYKELLSRFPRFVNVLVYNEIKHKIPYNVTCALEHAIFSHGEAVPEYDGMRVEYLTFMSAEDQIHFTLKWL